MMKRTQIREKKKMSKKSLKQVSYGTPVPRFLRLK